MPKETFFNLPEEKRQRVLQVALEEFADHSYNHASVSKIAREANIAKGSIYQYFAGKKELFFYLVELAGQTKLGFLSERMRAIDWEDFFEGYKSLIMVATEFELHNPLHAKLLQQAVESPYIEELYGEMKQSAAGFMQPLLERALAAGQLRKDVPPDMLAFFANALTTEFGSYLAQKAGFTDWKDVVYEENLARVLELDLAKHVSDLVAILRDGMASTSRGD